MIKYRIHQIRGSQMTQYRILVNPFGDMFYFQRGTEYWLSKLLRIVCPQITPKIKWEFTEHIEYNEESALNTLEHIKKMDIYCNPTNWKVFYNTEEEVK